MYSGNVGIASIPVVSLVQRYQALALKEGHGASSAAHDFSQNKSSHWISGSKLPPKGTWNTSIAIAWLHDLTSVRHEPADCATIGAASTNPCN
jgi:hypothetical protein